MFYRNSPRLTVDNHDARGLPSPNPRQEFKHEGTPLVVLHKDTLARGNSSRKGRHKGHAVSSSSTRGLPSPVLHTRGTLAVFRSYTRELPSPRPTQGALCLHERAGPTPQRCFSTKSNTRGSSSPAFGSFYPDLTHGDMGPS
uniref:Uncharacterized protein n=1 Tax=Branchiostoma floridae TaxID=7739 RepID=C3ZW80_BRAFL|eukprot:XP_002587200.1 hypothetical protein BRAFLDRAFT_102086 [Branchiostoma floridae]